MRLRFTSLVAALLVVFSAAAEANLSLVIHRTDGTTTVFALDEQPVTSFTRDDLVITTSTDSYSYPLTNIQRFTYENATTVNSIRHTGILVAQRGGYLVVSGLQAGQIVTLYGIDGRQMATAQAYGSAPVSIPLSHLPGGVYVVKADCVTFKILKK